MAQRSIRLAVALASVLTVVATGARAQDAANQPADPEVVGTGSTYEVKFKDDPLGALPNGVIIPRLSIRKTIGYPRLHRARAQFVREMLKSVDTL